MNFVMISKDLLHVAAGLDAVIWTVSSQSHDSYGTLISSDKLISVISASETRPTLLRAFTRQHLKHYEAGTPAYEAKHQLRSPDATAPRRLSCPPLHKSYH